MHEEGFSVVEAGVSSGRNGSEGQAAQAGHRPYRTQACDLVTVPARQGLEAVDILPAAGTASGPVLHDGTCDTLGFLVPAGTAAAGTCRAAPVPRPPGGHRAGCAVR